MIKIAKYTKPKYQWPIEQPHNQYASRQQPQLANTLQHTMCQAIVFVILLMSMQMRPVAAQVYPSWGMKQIGSADGLSSSAVMSVFQDNSGLMWFGTNDGINVYDGRNITIYHTDQNKKISILSNLILDIAQADDDNVWISTNLGINLFSARKQCCIAAFPQFRNYYVVLSNTKGQTWVIDENAVYYYMPTKRKFARTDISVRDVAHRLWFVDEEGALWLTYKNGKTIRCTVPNFNNATQKPTQQTVQISMNGMRFAFIHKGMLAFVDGMGNLFLYNTLSRMKIFVRNISQMLSQYGRIMNILPAKDRIFICFLQGQLFALDAQQFYQERLLNSDARIFNAFYDSKQDILWVGTDCQGVMQYSQRKHRFNQLLFSQTNNIVNRPVHGLRTDRSGNLWIGTKGDGIVRIPRGTNGNYDLQHAHVYFPGYKIDIAHYKRDRREYPVFKFEESKFHNGFWIGGDMHPALAFYDATTDCVVPMNRTDTMQYVHGICEQDAHTLWVATLGTGLFRVRLNPSGRSVEKSEQIILKANGKSIIEYNAMMMEGDSVLWLASRGAGLIRFDVRTWRYVRYRLSRGASSPSDDILSMHRTGNIFWLGTNSGLVRLALAGNNTYKMRHVGREGRLVNDMIHGILEDNMGLLWLSTDHGLVVYNPKNGLMHNYHLNNGIKLGEFCDDAYYRCPYDGRLFFGTINGVEYFNSVQQPKLSKSTLRFQEMWIDGNSVPYSNHYDAQSNRLLLSGNNLTLRLRFAILDYANTDDYEFAYRIKERAGTWSQFSSSDVVTLKKLRPGNYTLCIMAKTGVSNQNIFQYELPIHISPPWYASWWAYCLYLIIISATIATAYHLWRKIRQQNKLVWKLQYYESHHNESQMLNHRIHNIIGSTADIIDKTTRLRAGCTNEERNRMLSDICDKLVLLCMNANDGTEAIPDLTSLMPKSYVTGQKLNIKEVVTETVAMIIRNATCDLSNIDIKLNANSEAAIPDHPLRYIMSNLLTECAQTVAPVKFSVEITPTEAIIHIAAPNHIAEGLQVNTDVQPIEADNTETMFQRSLYIYAIRLLQCATTITDGGIDIHIPQAELAKQPDRDNAPSKTLLLLEREQHIQLMITDMMRNSYRVITTKTIKEAMAWLARNHADVFVADTVPYSGIESQFIEFIKSIQGTLQQTLFVPIFSWYGLASLNDYMCDASDSFVIAPYGLSFLPQSIKQAEKHQAERLGAKQNLQDNTPCVPNAAVEMTNEAPSGFIHRFVEIVDSNLDNDNLSPALIASEMNMSQRQFYRRFKEVSLLSPAVYIKNYRIEKAAQMLRTTDKNIIEILTSAGFKSKAYFYKEFAQRYGCTPMEYKKKNV